MALKFFLDFKNLNNGRLKITEPQGMDAVDFRIIREKGRLGIDVMYAGQEGSFRLGIQSHTEAIKRLWQYQDLFGYESIVYFGIEVNPETTYLQQVDFNTAKTDKVSYFEFATKPIGAVQLFKLRYDVPTDLTTYFTLDKQSIQPIKQFKILAPAKPVIQISSWDTSSQQLSGNFSFFGQDGFFIAPFIRQIKTGIDNSTVPFTSFFPANNLSEGVQIPIRDQSTLVRSQTNLRDVTVRIRNLNFTLGVTGFPVRVILRVLYGTGYSAGQYQFITLVDQTVSGGFSINNGNWNVPIPLIPNTGVMWISLSVTSPRPPAGGVISTASYSLTGGEAEVTATSVAFDSTVQMCRVYDVMRQNAFRTSGMNVSAPRWQALPNQPIGEFYDDFMTTQSMMRNLDKPINISTKEIVEDYLPFCNGDYQVNMFGDNPEVLYDRYPSFYQDIQIGDFPQVPTEEYNVTVDENADINRLSIGFTTFQSQKENENANTQDEVHGNLQDLFPAKQAQNKRDIKIGGVMSAFSLEDARRKAYDLTESAATQDDSKKYFVYCKELPQNDPRRIRKETATLQHRATGSQLILTIFSDSQPDENGNIPAKFSWRLLGIEPGDTFSINSANSAGTFTVFSVEDRVLTLQTPGGSPGFIASDNTTFTYRVGSSTTHIWETSERLESYENIADGDNYVNLPRTTSRIKRLYYKEFIATNLIYTPFGEIQNTEYNNNPAATTRFIGDTVSIREGEEYRCEGAILSPIQHNDMRLIMKFGEFLQLQKDFQEKRGFIRTLNSEGLPVKIFPLEMIFNFAFNNGKTNGNGFVTLTGIEKYERDILKIFRDDNGLTTINDKKITHKLQFEIDGFGKLNVYDAKGKRLYPAVMWNRVSVNGAIPNNEKELQQALS